MNAVESTFRARFPARHTLFVVVHVTSTEQAIRNTGIAQSAGADGVFLINHGIATTALRQAWSRVTSGFPGFWVGVNDLSSRGLSTAQTWPTGLPGVWEDHSVMASDGPGFGAAHANWAQWQQVPDRPLLFGGVAFKYGPDQGLTGAPLAELAAAASGLVDVITTSGPGTGHAADIAKIATMRQAVGDFPLAIASGITPQNIEDYLPHADAFLVATGISTSFDELDPRALRALADRVAG